MIPQSLYWGSAHPLRADCWRFLGLLFFSAVQAGRLYQGLRDPWLRGLSVGILGSILAFAVNGIWSPLLVRGIGIPFVLLLSVLTALTHLGLLWTAPQGHDPFGPLAGTMTKPSARRFTRD